MTLTQPPSLPGKGTSRLRGFDEHGLYVEFDKTGGGWGCWRRGRPRSRVRAVPARSSPGHQIGLRGSLAEREIGAAAGAERPRAGARFVAERSGLNSRRALA